MTLGQKIRSLRKKENLNLRELGKLVNTDFTYLSKIENDKTDGRAPSEKLIRRLAEVLKADENELLSLAARIPTELKNNITSNPEAIGFFRNLSGKLSSEDWKVLKEKAEELSKKKER